MRSRKQKKKELSEEQLEIIDTKDFFDRIAPGIIRFYTDHYICGNFYKSCWALCSDKNHWMRSLVFCFSSSICGSRSLADLFDFM